MVRSPVFWSAIGVTAVAAVPLDIVLLMDTSEVMEPVWEGVSSSIPYIAEYLHTVHPESKLGVIGMSGADSKDSCVQLSASLAPMTHWKSHTTSLKNSLAFGGHKDSDEYFKAVMSVAYDRGHIKWTQDEDRSRLVLALTSHLPSSDPKSADGLPPALAGGEDAWAAWDTPCEQLPAPAPEFVQSELLSRDIGVAVLLMEPDHSEAGATIEKGKCEGECGRFAHKFVQTVDAYIQTAQASGHSAQHDAPETSTAVVVVHQEALADKEDVHRTQVQEIQPHSLWWVFPRKGAHEHSAVSPSADSTTTEPLYHAPRWGSEPIWWFTVRHQGAAPEAEKDARGSSGDAEKDTAAVADTHTTTPHPMHRALTTQPGYGTWWWVVTLGRNGSVVKPAFTVRKQDAASEAKPASDKESRGSSGDAEKDTAAVADTHTTTSHPMHRALTTLPGYGTWWWVVTLGRNGSLVKPAF